ncbi:hypothetical protein F0169_00975 [Pseudomonas sp. MAFF 212408]|uniref:Uncharacterized protein n=1 Tax=Pseudomonas kitaguniensis TaxID=2607908 RepID=A0A5N7KF52_9PSED|nr:hypothetical protein [Pseudomonas kitaguniensis]
MKKLKVINIIKLQAMFLTSLSIVTGSALAGENVKTVDVRSFSEGCYGYLTELVRSSNFPFRYTTRDKVNLLIDNDDGERVFAQLNYETSGEGIVGWVTYYINDQLLVNSSADLEEPVALSYDKEYAEQYEDCASKHGHHQK